MRNDNELAGGSQRPPARGVDPVEKVPKQILG